MFPRENKARSVDVLSSREDGVELAFIGMAQSIAGKASVMAGSILCKLGFFVELKRDVDARFEGGVSDFRLHVSSSRCEVDHATLDFAILFDDSYRTLTPKPFSEETVILCCDVALIADLRVGQKWVFEIPSNKLLSISHLQYSSTRRFLIALLSAIFYADSSCLNGELFGLDLAELHSMGGQSRLLIRQFTKGIKKNKKEAGRFLSGNEAVSFGSRMGGCNFIAAYPITPATTIFDFMQSYAETTELKVIQAEDEIAAINMAIGASYGGSKAMTVTSGPGLSLMSESIGFAEMIEVPLVIVNCMRAGPSTGMPTKSEQSDILHALWGGHGDSFRVVIMPGDHNEILELSKTSFDIAEFLQTVVIVLIEGSLALDYSTLSKACIDKHAPVAASRVLKSVEPGVRYQRYDLSQKISPRVVPGTAGGEHVCTAAEHDTFGEITTNPVLRNLMMKRRLQKLELAGELINGLSWEGEADASIGIITCGSVYRQVRVAREILLRKNINVKILKILMLCPLPTNQIEAFLSSVSKIFFIEMNATGQMEMVVRGKVKIGPRSHSYRKFDGTLFRAEHIAAYIEMQMQG